MPIDFNTDNGRVRLLINDVAEGSFVFTDDEINAFLAIEGDVVKLAAAQAIESQATNEALASKVLRTPTGQTTDGAKLADSMRKHAAALRAQAAAESEDSDDGFFFDVVDIAGDDSRPERTAWPY